MSVTDSIADFIVALRNASVSHKIEAITRFSNFKVDILKVLKKEGFIEDYTTHLDNSYNLPCNQSRQIRSFRQLRTCGIILKDRPE